MVEDQGSKEEKLEFTPEGEALGYISLDQARVLAMRTARETPGAYGLFYADIPMAFDVVEAGQTEDHYVITLSFRPQGEFAGRAGREQFFFEKEGNVAHRQVLSLPSLRRRIPRIAAAVGLALVAAIAVGVSIGVARGGGDDAEIGIGPGLTVEASVSTEGESPEGANEPQNETPGSSAIDPLDPTAGLDYLPVNQEGFLEIPADLSIAQTFTASANGVITGAEIIGLSRHQCAADEALGFRLLATNNGLPGDLVFYSGTLSVASIPKEPANIEIKFGPNGWPVGAFESLALQLLNATESSSCYYIWDADWGGTYTGGQAFIQSAGSNEWKPDSRDMGFRVFFRPESDTATPVPTISSLSTQDLLSQPWRQSRRGDEPDEPWNERIGLLTVSTDHSTLYALNTEGCISNCRLYRSFDQGKTWWPIPLPFGWSATLALRAVDAREIYAWSGTTMWRSVDGGNQWTQLHTPTGISNPGVSPYIRAFAVSPEMLYMATADQNYESGGLFQSPDKGENWRLINGWLPGITLLSVAGDPATMYLVLSQP